MYNILIWKDHVINPNNTYTVKENADGTVTLTPYGEVLQQGTNMSATNFNNIEFGVSDCDLATRIILAAVRNVDDRLVITEGALDGIVADYKAELAAIVTEYRAESSVEEKTVTLNNTAAYPFNNSVQSVSLSAAKKNKNYSVEYEITSRNGNVGEIEITDKQLNGFKIAYTGSAKSVKLKLFIKGGTI